MEIHGIIEQITLHARGGRVTADTDITFQERMIRLYADTPDEFAAQIRDFGLSGFKYLQACIHDHDANVTVMASNVREDIKVLQFAGKSNTDAYLKYLSAIPVNLHQTRSLMPGLLYGKDPAFPLDRYQKFTDNGMLDICGLEIRMHPGTVISYAVHGRKVEIFYLDRNYRAARKIIQTDPHRLPDLTNDIEMNGLSWDRNSMVLLGHSPINHDTALSFPLNQWEHMHDVCMDVACPDEYFMHPDMWLFDLFKKPYKQVVEDMAWQSGVSPQTYAKTSDVYEYTLQCEAYMEEKKQWFLTTYTHPKETVYDSLPR